MIKDKLFACGVLFLINGVLQTIVGQSDMGVYCMDMASKCFEVV